MRETNSMPVKIHPSADVSPKATLGDGTSVWHSVQIRENVKIGHQCIVGKNTYIDFDVTVGDRCKIQNNCSIYHGASLGNGVFVGPHVVFANDRTPRAVNPDGSLKSASDWTVTETRVEDGASIGAHSVVLPGVRLGKWCMVGAGSCVTRDVPDHGLAFGNPARLHGFVCACGRKGEDPKAAGAKVTLSCPTCGKRFDVEKSAFDAWKR